MGSISGLTSILLLVRLVHLQSRIEISDISADISVIYRISAYSEAIFATENRL